MTYSPCYERENLIINQKTKILALAQMFLSIIPKNDPGENILPLKCNGSGLKPRQNSLCD